MTLSHRSLLAGLAVALLRLLAACSDAPPGGPSSATLAAPVELAIATAVADSPSITASPAPTTSSPDGDSPSDDETTRPPAPTPTWPAAGAQVPCGVLLPILSDGPQPATRQFGPLAGELALPDVARPAYERILAAPKTVGLAAFQIGREAEGVYLNADVPMPLASVVKIINLIAYGRAAAAGELDPAEWVPLDEIAQTYLPRSDLGAHNRAIQDLEERRLIAFDPPATPLEEVPWMMIRYSSNAAADYLHLRLGQRTIEQTVIDLGLTSHTAPCPWIGQFLAIANHQTTGSNRQTVQAYIAGPERYGREAMRLAESYALDAGFRATESNPGWRASFDTQLLFADNLNAQASAGDYAGLMSRIAQNQLSSGYTNIVVRRALEWPMAFPVNQELFSNIGLKDGSLPGVLTTAYYATRIEDGAAIVVVLFYRQLPRQTYNQWRRDLPHDEFARWLLSDPAAIPQLRAALEPS